MRGPSAKPVEIRLLEGTAGQVVAIPTTNDPAVMPETLRAAAIRVWELVVASFTPNYFKSVDTNHLAGYCRATVLWERATQEIEDALERGDEPHPKWLRHRRG